MNFRRTLKILLTYPRLKLLEKMRLNHFGKGTWIGGNTLINRSHVGNHVYIATNCVINNVIIGSYSSIAPGVQIGGMEHNYKGLTTCAHLSGSQTMGTITVIGEDVWIGANVVVRQGVKIGRGAVIGACSLVTHDVEPYSVVYGLPARFNQYRFGKEIITALEESKYWEYDKVQAKIILDNIKSNINDKSNNIRNL